MSHGIGSTVTRVEPSLPRLHRYIYYTRYCGEAQVACFLMAPLREQETSEIKLKAVQPMQKEGPERAEQST